MKVHSKNHPNRERGWQQQCNSGTSPTNHHRTSPALSTKCLAVPFVRRGAASSARPSSLISGMLFWLFPYPEPPWRWYTSTSSSIFHIIDPLRWSELLMKEGRMRAICIDMVKIPGLSYGKPIKVSTKIDLMSCLQNIQTRALCVLPDIMLLIMVDIL